MFYQDALTLDAPRRTSDGYLAVRAKAARVGHYEYTGRDVDPDNKHGFRDQAIVKVAREADQVFDKASAHSFIGKPITNDHPRDAVTSTNWKDHASGTIMGAKWEEGGYLSFDLMLTDAAAIAAVEGGKRELSNGYSCDLIRGDFTAADGTVCPFKQVNIRGNHVALVDRGRAGPECAIADAAPCDRAPRSIFDSLTTQEKPVSKLLTVDGYSVDVANVEVAERTISTLLTARDAANKTVDQHVTTIADKDRELATKDGKIAELEAKVADQTTIDALADAKAEIVTRGKTLLGDAMPDVKGKTIADTRRAIVLAATKDAALADKSDDYIEARFDGLKDAKSGVVQTIGSPVILGDAAAREATAYSKANDHNSWRAAGKAA